MSSSDEDYEDYERMWQKRLEKLKRMREEVNWEIEEDRQKLFRNVHSLIGGWDVEYPNLRDIFRREEIDWLLIEDVKTESGPEYELQGDELVKFAIRAGYKDEPKLDEDGKPILRRTTALHWAARQYFYYFYVAWDLFHIYDDFEANYVDELGLTHFHVACKCGCDEACEKFLEHGHDPNCIAPEKGNSTLHYALGWGCERMTRMLLQAGADPNLANWSEGSTPLHIVCQGNLLLPWRPTISTKLATILFEFSKEKRRDLRVDARDKQGRTPLQWAVAGALPDTVDVLLDNGADLSSFVFPTEAHFDEVVVLYEERNLESKFHLILTSGVLAVVERLEKRGYQLDRNDALTIIKFSSKHGLFKNSVNVDRYYFSSGHEKFVSVAKQLMFAPNLSLYDLTRLRPKEAEKLLTYSDYFKFTLEHDFKSLPKAHYEACIAHMCEIMWGKFYRAWIMDVFLVLTRYRLPILCCRAIIENLESEDLLKICLATEIDTTEQSKNL